MCHTCYRFLQVVCDFVATVPVVSRKCSNVQEIIDFQPNHGAQPPTCHVSLPGFGPGPFRGGILGRGGRRIPSALGKGGGSRRHPKRDRRQLQGNPPSGARSELTLLDELSTKLRTMPGCVVKHDNNNQAPCQQAPCKGEKVRSILWQTFLHNPLAVKRISAQIVRFAASAPMFNVLFDQPPSSAGAEWEREALEQKSRRRKECGEAQALDHRVRHSEVGAMGAQSAGQTQLHRTGRAACRAGPNMPHLGRMAQHNRRL